MIINVLLGGQQRPLLLSDENLDIIREIIRTDMLNFVCDVGENKDQEITNFFYKALTEAATLEGIETTFTREDILIWLIEAVRQKTWGPILSRLGVEAFKDIILKKN